VISNLSESGIKTILLPIYSLEARVTAIL